MFFFYQERLSRYYYLYAPERLANVSREAWNYRKDAEPLYCEVLVTSLI